MADVLFGDVPASGALPFTIPLNVMQLGDIEDYSMVSPPYGNTYRYLQYQANASAGNSSNASQLMPADADAAPLSDVLSSFPSPFGLSFFVWI